MQLDFSCIFQRWKISVLKKNKIKIKLFFNIKNTSLKIFWIKYIISQNRLNDIEKKDYIQVIDIIQYLSIFFSVVLIVKEIEIKLEYNTIKKKRKRQSNKHNLIRSPESDIVCFKTSSELSYGKERMYQLPEYTSEISLSLAMETFLVFVTVMLLGSQILGFLIVDA